MATIADQRATLASAFSSLAATSYGAIPESPMPPAIAIIPDSPYLEPSLLTRTTLRMDINYIILPLVAYNSNAAALDNLEQLIIGILQALPGGYIINNVGKPTQYEVGASNMLGAEIRVSTVYTQTN